MRILLFRDAFTPASPPKVTSFLTQVVRRAAEQGYELRELVSYHTDADKGEERYTADMRRRLDGEVLSFDPQVIHVHGVGTLGHLALESGVPYLVSAFGEELLIGQTGFASRSQAQQALENAGFVVIDGEQARRYMEDSFGGLESLLVVPEMEASSDADSFDWLWPLYRQIVAARRGPRPTE